MSAEQSVAEMEQCWKSIGVFGDASCPQLGEKGHCRNCPDYTRVARGLLDREVSPELLHTWTEQFSTAKEIQSHETVSLVVFRLQNEWLALSTGVLREGSSLRSVHSVPSRTSPHFRGLVNVNGELVLCVSLESVLSVPQAEAKSESTRRIYPRMLVIEKDKECFAFPVQEILGVLRVPKDVIGEPPDTLERSPDAITRAVARIDGRTVGLLDEDKLFRSLKGVLSK